MKKLIMSMKVSENNHFEKQNNITYAYINFFENLNYIIYLIPNNTKNIDEYLNLNIDLVVLTGGNNVDPMLYNSKSVLNEVYLERDNVEYHLIKYAVHNNIKVIGVCRGFQILNVFFNGKLLEIIENHTNKNHKIHSEMELLNNIYVNSYHRQGVDLECLGDNLYPIAMNLNIVEAFIHKEKKY